MAKLFLSFLGANNYEPCVYYQGQKPPLPERRAVRFVQEATIGRYCKEWGAGDRIVIFTTRKAYEKNWLDGGHGECSSEVGFPWEGLKTRIAAMGLDPGLKAQNVHIPDGSDEAEIWEIFRIVYDTIQKGDEVVFDITHAFRSIPMLAIVILSYARVLKEITIAGIYYGAFEILGSLNEVKSIPIDHRLAPILDLTPIAELLEWTSAVDRFVNSGDPARVSALTKAGVRPILKQTKGADQAADTLRRIADSLERFCAVMSTCRSLKITEAAERLNILLASLERSEILPPFSPLFNFIKNNLRAFQGNRVEDGLQAVAWCMNHGLIQQGFTILNELLISWVLSKTIGETNDVKLRSLPSHATTILREGLQGCPERWDKIATENRDLVRRIIILFEEDRDILDTINKIRDYRNDMNHAGYRENPINEKNFSKALKELLEKVSIILLGQSGSQSG